MVLIYFFMLFVYRIKILNCNKRQKRKLDLHKFSCNVDVSELDYKRAAHELCKVPKTSRYRLPINWKTYSQLSLSRLKNFHMRFTNNLFYLLYLLQVGC